MKKDAAGTSKEAVKSSRVPIHGRCAAETALE